MLIRATKLGDIEIELSGRPDDAYIRDGYSVTLDRELTDEEMEELTEAYFPEIYQEIIERIHADNYDRWKDSRYE